MVHWFPAPRLTVAFVLLFRGPGLLLACAATDAPARYESRSAHDPNGIGKFFLGREIAAVMGHEGAEWLERPEREEEEHPKVLIDLLGIRAGETVADVGAGSGYLTWRLAQAVGPRGKVYGVDVQMEMLSLLSRNMAKRGLTNVIPVLGSITNVNLGPNSIDLALMVDVYHEFSHPFEMIESICRALRPGGRIVFVEYRAEDASVPIKTVHKMSAEQVRKEMQEHALTLAERHDALPRQHVLVFRRTPAIPSSGEVAPLQRRGAASTR